MASATACQAAELFFTEFRDERQAVERHIEQSSQIPIDQLPAHFTVALQRINNLEKSITKANAFIPSYDEQQYSQQIKDLSAALEGAKSRLTPKPKFTFKSRKKKEPTQQLTPQQLQQQTIAKASPPKATPSLLDHSVGWSDQVDRTLTLDHLPTNEQGVNVLLSNLTRCVIDLKSHPTVKVTALHMKNLKECVIVSNTIHGSVLIYGLTQSTMAVHCHQLRMHDATNADILLNVSSHPILEDSNAVRVGRYFYGEAESTPNYYDTMEDFNWLKKQASPHWSLLPDERTTQLNASIAGPAKLGLHLIPPPPP